LRNHDRDAFDVFCYSDAAKSDSHTARMRAIGHNWRDIAGLDDARVAKIIEEDRIDVLVDLTLHMAGNRMLVFARRPAPVQMSYLGYPATTGLAEMDFRLTDPYLDPPGARGEAGIERLIHLPCYWCYVPPPDCPAVNDLPAKQKGYVTFGCLNNFTKVNSRALALWARLLREIPNARLLLHVHGGASGNAHLRPMFETLGVDAKRIEFAPAGPRAKFIAAYQQIDIALDPFPYGGGVTSMDALWMGMPLVTLAGHHALSRAGACVLGHVGLGELVARDLDHYIDIANLLAGDLERLSALRGSLRQRMIGSPLMDPLAFTRSLEWAYVDATERAGRRIT
jgi:predicted O-linked N-acetylglucosamine transferase (SPINDLY family)